MQEQLRQLLSSKGVNMDDVSYGFHWPPFNSIDHLHMHAIAPASKMRFTAKIVFKPINLWFCTVRMTKKKIKIYGIYWHNNEKNHSFISFIDGICVVEAETSKLIWKNSFVISQY